MDEVESRLERRPRATHGAVAEEARTEETKPGNSYRDHGLKNFRMSIQIVFKTLEGDIVNKLYFLALIFALTSGCANNAQNNSQKVKLVGVKNVPVIPASGPVERVYFTSVDGRESKTIWSSYPEKLDIWPGEHVVVVVCEWRPTATAPPMSKGFRRIEDTFETGHIYEFTSTLERLGECSISYKDVTSGKAN